MILETEKYGATSRSVDTARHSGGPSNPAVGRARPTLDARMGDGHA